jgi:hypothetical protein
MMTKTIKYSNFLPKKFLLHIQEHSLHEINVLLEEVCVSNPNSGTTHCKLSVQRSIFTFRRGCFFDALFKVSPIFIIIGKTALP